jgi:hypothetical protein
MWYCQDCTARKRSCRAAHSAAFARRPRVNGPGERNGKRAAHIHIHDVGNPVVRGETHDEEIVICLKRLRARLAAEVAQRLSPHVPGPAVHHDSEVSGTLGKVQVDRAQHVEAGTSAWQTWWHHGRLLV